MSDDLVNQLWESDEASALTNRAARRIEELETKLSKSEALLKKAVKMAYEQCPFEYGTEGYYDWIIATNSSQN